MFVTVQSNSICHSIVKSRREFEPSEWSCRIPSITPIPTFILFKNQVKVHVQTIPLNCKPNAKLQLCCQPWEKVHTDEWKTPVNNILPLQWGQHVTGCIQDWTLPLVLLICHLECWIWFICIPPFQHHRLLHFYEGRPGCLLWHIKVLTEVQPQISKCSKNLKMFNFRLLWNWSI